MKAKMTRSWWALCVEQQGGDDANRAFRLLLMFYLAVVSMMLLLCHGLNLVKCCVPPGMLK